MFRRAPVSLSWQIKGWPFFKEFNGRLGDDAVYKGMQDVLVCVCVRSFGLLFCVWCRLSFILFLWNLYRNMFSKMFITSHSFLSQSLSPSLTLSLYHSLPVCFPSSFPNGSPTPLALLVDFPPIWVRPTFISDLKHLDSFTWFSVVHFRPFFSAYLLKTLCWTAAANIIIKYIRVCI